MARRLALNQEIAGSSPAPAASRLNGSEPDIWIAGPVCKTVRGSHMGVQIPPDPLHDRNGAWRSLDDGVQLEAGQRG